MRLHFATAELAPLCQSGGLGDAVSGLARALGARGHDVTCVLPGYRDVLEHIRREDPGSLAAGPVMEVRLPGQTLEARFWLKELFPGVQVALCDMPAFFDRPGIYGDGDQGYPDHDLRFIAFSRAVAYFAEVHFPDLLVAHDHHAAMSLAMLRTSLARGRNVGIGAVQVVHNNAYQGRAPANFFGATGLAGDLFHPDAVEFHGGINLLKAGAAFADRIVAVSETYAREIQAGQMGEGLEGIYSARKARLCGIPNGIDTARFDPSADGHLPAHFEADRLDGKAACRRVVLEELGLATPAPGRFLVAIGRLAEQKGWDVLAHSLDGLVDQGASVALLGDGDPRIAARLKEAGRRYPDKVAVRIGYDGGLARRLYAGGDGVLIPSRFEPCGLVQLIAQRYGTVPVAHAVGGLVDTICDPSFPGSGHEEGELTGVLFAPLDTRELLRATARLAALGENAERLAETRRRLMSLDVSWATPARRWEGILDDVAKEARGRL